MIRTTCPQCGREDAIADYLASLPVLCKQCGHRVTMGEVIAPTKPPAAPPPVAKAPPPPPPPPPAPPKVVAPPQPPPAPKPAPLPKPEPALPILAEAEPLDLEPPVHTNGTVITPRAAFLNAEGPGKVDLFEDVVIPEQRTARPPLPPVPPPPLLPAPLPVAPVGVSFHRGRRLAARLITLVGAVIALVAGILLVGFAPGVVKNDKLMSAVFLVVPIGLYALYNAVLLGTQGQDFGKRALKLRVVGDDGTPARFAQAFLKRELVVLLLLAGLIPLAWKLYKFQQAGELVAIWKRLGAGMFSPTVMPEVLPAAAAVLFSLLNAALIFGRDGKCLHDKLAKTRVDRDGEPPTPVPPAPAPPPRPQMPSPTIPRPPVVPSVGFIQQPPAPVPDPPRRGSLADYVSQVSKELPVITEVKKAKLEEAEPRDIPFLIPSSRRRRLAARFLNRIIETVCWYGGVALAIFAPPNVKDTLPLLFAIAYTPLAVYGIVTLYFFAKNGQDVGKRILGIKIVRDDGSRAGIWYGFLRREVAYDLIAVSFSLLGLLIIKLGGSSFGVIAMPLALLTIVAILADRLAIFGVTQRCLHDRLAGTIVVYDNQYP